PFAGLMKTKLPARLEKMKFPILVRVIINKAKMIIAGNHMPGGFWVGKDPPAIRLVQSEVYLFRVQGGKTIEVIKPYSWFEHLVGFDRRRYHKKVIYVIQPLAARHAFCDPGCE